MKITDKLAILAELLFVLYIFSFDQKKKKITDNLKTREVIGLIKKETKREVIGWMIEVKKKKKNVKLSSEVRTTISLVPQTSTYYHVTFLHLKKKKKTETINSVTGFIFSKK